MSNALSDVLFGDAEPSGRLPTTYPERIEHTPSFGNFPGEHGEVRYGEGLLVGYRWYDSRSLPVRFPFGHGLSYTTWERSGLTVEAGSTADDLTVSVTTTNTGDRPGTDVVQLFFTDEVASVGLPTSRLLGFARVQADPGESTTVRFTVPAGRLGFTDADLRFRVEPGDFTFRVGDLSETATLTGDVAFPDRNGLPPVTSGR